MSAYIIIETGWHKASLLLDIVPEVSELQWRDETHILPLGGHFDGGGGERCLTGSKRCEAEIW